MEVALGQRPPAGERRFRAFGPIPEDDEQPALDGARPLAERPAALGISARGVDEPTRQRLGLPVARGALVVEVVAGSPADKAGIPVDAVIVAADDRPADLADVVRLGHADQEVELSYFFQGELVRTTVRLAAAGVDDAPAELPPADEAAARIEALDRRIQELEQRIEVLEGALRNGT
jgi:predicted metalloprotease with PDZ domain